MKKLNIKIGNIYETENRGKNLGGVRAARFSASIHKRDENLKGGNSTRALEWAKGFRIK